MCNGIGNRREATGNSKMRIAFDSTSVSGTAVFQPFVPEGSEKISKNQYSPKAEKGEAEKGTGWF